MESSVRILINSIVVPFLRKRYICIELSDEIQSVAVQRNYMVAKSLPITSQSPLYAVIPTDTKKFLILIKDKKLSAIYNP